MAGEKDEKMRLGDMLVAEGVITQEQLQNAINYQAEKGGRLGNALVDMGFVSQDVIMAFVGTQLGIPHVNLEDYGTIPGTVLQAVPESLCVKQCLVPITQHDNRLTVAMADPLNMVAIDDIKLSTGFDVETVISSEADIRAAIERYYGVAAQDQQKQSSSEPTTDMNQIISSMGKDGNVEVMHEEAEQTDISSLEAAGEEAPVVKVVNAVITEAVRIDASDIHIEPFEDKLRIRFRVDGVLQEVQAPPRQMCAALASRIKIMSDLDIAERRKPQDGKIKVKVLGKDIDIRVSIIPVAMGEKICMRILDSSNLSVNLEDLGFLTSPLANFSKVITEPYGMVLVCGPTGSGKSTTLYSALSTINDPEKNIQTVENPIEYKLFGINQVQVNPGVVSFADALRAFLRQDPDVIMVGEIRDQETAEIAVEASLTGHLVFGTLHTNDAPQAITRLIQMEVEPIMVCSTLLAAVGQRLMRKICADCKEAYQPTQDEWNDVTRVPAEFKPAEGTQPVLYRGKGCPKCGDSGYKGRTAIHEVMVMNENLREKIVKHASTDELKHGAREAGMVTLREAARVKVMRGETCYLEMIKVAKED